MTDLQKWLAELAKIIPMEAVGEEWLRLRDKQMKERETQLSSDEIAEFVVPIVKLFSDTFNQRKESIMAVDLVHICASVTASIIASCVHSDNPTDERQFKMVLKQTVEALIDQLNGRPYDYKARIT